MGKRMRLPWRWIPEVNVPPDRHSSMPSFWIHGHGHIHPPACGDFHPPSVSTHPLISVLNLRPLPCSRFQVSRSRHRQCPYTLLPPTRGPSPTCPAAISQMSNASARKRLMFLYLTTIPLTKTTRIRIRFAAKSLTTVRRT
jgi:hypothetical protein